MPSQASLGILKSLKTACCGAADKTNLVAGSMGRSSSNTLCSSQTEWLTVDPGATRRISKVVLYPRNDGVNRGYGFPINDTIAVSNDNLAWTTEVTQTGVANLGDSAAAFTLNSASGRCVSVNATKLRANPNDDNQDRLQFAEIKVC